MDRKNWIDWSKAIGIYLVVLGHCTFSNKDVLGFIYTFHMPLFFMISVFLYKNQIKSFRIYIKKLNDRLLMPYFFINLIVGIWEIIKYIIRGDNDYLPMIKEQLYGTLLGIPTKIFSGPTWFLLSLFWCQIFMFFYIRFKENGKKSYLLFSIPIFIFILVHNIGVSSFMGLGTFPIAIIYFFMMYNLKSKILIYIQNRKFYYCMFISFLLLFLTFCLYKVNGNSNLIISSYGNYFILGILGGILGSLGIFLLGYSLEKLESYFVIIISNSTILILGFHMTLMNIIELHIYNFQYNTISNIIISLIIVIMISLFFPFVAKRFPMLVGNRK